MSVVMSWYDLNSTQQEDYAWHLRSILGFGQRFLIESDEAAAMRSATQEQLDEAMLLTLRTEVIANE